MDARVKAIISHLTPIGWIIAFLSNSSQKEEYTSFYLRQTLGIYIIGFIIKMSASFIFFIGWAFALVLFAFWLLSLIYALQGARKMIPFGEYFQNWFKMV